MHWTVGGTSEDVPSEDVPSVALAVLKIMMFSSPTRDTRTVERDSPRSKDTP